jgi:hypothetical protein
MRSDLPRYVPVECVVMKLTRRAVLVKLEDLDDREQWIPQSLIHPDDLANIDDGVCGEIRVEEWFVFQEHM